MALPAPSDDAPDITGGNAGETGAGPERAAFIGFAADATTEHALRDGLGEYLGPTIDIRRGTIRNAISVLSRMPSPRVILVDLSGEENPVGALTDLSDVVEPDVRVLVIGEERNVKFYRELIHTLGVVEYVYKPLTAELVARLFSIAFDTNPASRSLLGGRLITVSGANGGAGASTVALNLATCLADESRRYTLLFDPDLHTGAITTLLGVQPVPGLKMIFEAPHRIDSLVISRTVQTISDRLSLLSGDEPLTSHPAYAQGAVGDLINSVAKRYNFIIADVSLRIGQVGYDLLGQAQQRVIVLEPTIVSLKDAVRLLALPRSLEQVRRPVLVLNKYQQPGGLTLNQVEEAIGNKPDVVVPYLPRQVIEAANLGEPALHKSGAFRGAIEKLSHEIDARDQAQAASGLRDMLDRTFARLGSRLGARFSR